jgi:5-methylcytosine-specific restriction endonuclease McrA
VENSGKRKVFKFKFCISEETPLAPVSPFSSDLDRVIPSGVKLEVWKRDKGCCVKCGSKQNLHFDHIIPYSLGGSSKNVENIQILCAKHNLEKHDRID